MQLTNNTWIAALALMGLWHCQPLARSADQEAVPGAAGNRATQWRERMQNLAKDLDLTDAQKEKLIPVFREQMQKMRETMQDTGLSQREKMERIKAMREESTPKLKEILTPEQFAKWQKQPLQSQSPQVLDRLQGLAKDLDLTDEQKAKLKPIFEAQAEKLRQLREDNSLSPREKLEKVKTLREEVDPKLKEVLTAEQFEKWQKKQQQALEEMKNRWLERRRQ